MGQNLPILNESNESTHRAETIALFREFLGHGIAEKNELKVDAFDPTRRGPRVSQTVTRVTSSVRRVKAMRTQLLTRVTV